MIKKLLASSLLFVSVSASAAGIYDGVWSVAGSNSMLLVFENAGTMVVASVDSNTAGIPTTCTTPVQGVSCTASVIANGPLSGHWTDTFHGAIAGNSATLNNLTVTGGVLSISFGSASAATAIYSEPGMSNNMVLQKIF